MRIFGDITALSGACTANLGRAHRELINKLNPEPRSLSKKAGATSDSPLSRIDTLNVTEVWRARNLAHLPVLQ